MANPVYIAVPAGEWVTHAVLTAVTVGTVVPKDRTVKYVYARVDTGGDPPSDDTIAIELPPGGKALSHSAPSDYYIKCPIASGAVIADAS